MFRPRLMDQVEILLLRRDLRPTLKALAAAQIIHLYHLGSHHDRDRNFPAESGRHLERLREFAVRASHVAAELGIEQGPGEFVEADDIPGWENQLEGLRDNLEKIRKIRKEQRRCRLRLIAAVLLFRRISGFSGAFERMVKLRISSLQLGLVPEESLYDLSELPDGCRIHALARIGGQRLVAVIHLRSSSKETARLLNSVPFVPIPLFRRVRGDIGEVEMRIRRLLSRLRHRDRRLDLRMEEMRRTHQADLRNRIYSAGVEIHLLEQQREFSYTRRTVAIGGWVPARRLKELEGILQRNCSGHFQIERVAAKGSDTPVLLSNPRLMHPFEKILQAYGTPSYGEIEPTPLLAAGFVVLFGMMFGDLGHGLVLLLAGLSIRRWTRWRDEGLIMAEVGCFSALFGLFFGSFFGWEELFEPLWFSPMHDITRLMMIALATGVGLMTAGMGLRVANGLRQENPAAVITDRYGVAGIVFYLGSLFIGYLVYQAAVSPIALGFLFLPLAAVFSHPFFDPGEKGTPAYLLCAEGGVEVIETVLGFLANTFSFLRVAAFGLAHVGLSLAVFALADEAVKLPFGLFFAALIHLFGNLVILVLEGLIVSIQTVRLEFYEFFGKFFRGGGKRFRPLTLDPFAERRT